MTRLKPSTKWNGKLIHLKYHIMNFARVMIAELNKIIEAIKKMVQKSNSGI